MHGSTRSALKIKVCGMREPHNIASIAALSPDLMGFLFYPKSARYAVPFLDTEQMAALDPAITKIGVFVDATSDILEEMAETYALNGFQLHGAETPEFCAWVRQRWPKHTLIKAFGMASEFDFGALAPYAECCDAFLFDTKVPQHGGSGKMFDWSLLQDYPLELPFLLAGGISPSSAEALREFQAQEPRLWGVDLNSQFESEVGHKSVRLVSHMLRELRN